MVLQHRLGNSIIILFIHRACCICYEYWLYYLILITYRIRRTMFNNSSNDVTISFNVLNLNKVDRDSICHPISHSIFCLKGLQNLFFLFSFVKIRQFLTQSRKSKLMEQQNEQTHYLNVVLSAF